MGDAIDKAKADLLSFGQEILKQRGAVAVLTAEIKEYASKIKDNLELQEEATNVRAKENEDYQAQTAEMKEVLTALERAITVLKKENERSLLQTSAHISTAARASAIKNVLQKLPSMTLLKVEQLTLLQKAVKSETGYAPQSESIQGILGNMYDTFANDLQETTQQEAKSNRHYETFIETKQG